MANPLTAGHRPLIRSRRWCRLADNDDIGDAGTACALGLKVRVVVKGTRERAKGLKGLSGIGNTYTRGQTMPEISCLSNNRSNYFRHMTSNGRTPPRRSSSVLILKLRGAFVKLADIYICTFFGEIKTGIYARGGR